MTTGSEASAALGSMAILPPLIHPTTTLAEAVRGNSLGIGYAGGGFLVFYYIGVSKVLQQLGIIKPGFVKTAGASVGVLSQAVDYPGVISHDRFIEEGIKFNLACRANRNCVYTLDEAFAKMMDKMLPQNISDIVNGKACDVFTWYNDGHPKGDYVCTYKDRADVMAALRTGCYVPGWAGPARYTWFRGKKAYDGAFQQLFPCPPNVTYCIKVAGLAPVDSQRTIEGLLDPFEVAASAKLVGETMAGVVGPDPVDTVETVMRDRTYEVLDMPGWVKLLAAAQRPLADIYPGKYIRSPLGPVQLLYHVFTPPDEATTRLMYKMGQDEARAWARAQGWPGTRRRVT